MIDMKYKCRTRFKPWWQNEKWWNSYWMMNDVNENLMY